MNRQWNIVEESPSQQRATPLNPNVVENMQGLLGRRPQAARNPYIWGWCQICEGVLHFLGPSVVKNMQGLLGHRSQMVRHPVGVEYPRFHGKGKDKGSRMRFRTSNIDSLTRKVSKTSRGYEKEK